MEDTIRDKVQWMVRDEVIISYLEACKEAATDEEKFKVFKQDPRITHIFEHVSKDIALNYLDLIQKQTPELFKKISLLDNDKYGNPILENFGGLKCSPSTIQYIGVLSNLIREFELLHNFDIIEIGGGYGGQCKIIQDVFKVNSYHIIDLLEPSLLQHKYLEKFNLKNVMINDYSKKQEYDLVISNYALSEVLEPLQTEYVKNILLNSKHGYITCNRVINSVHLIKEKFSTYKVLNDIKGENENNFIIIW